MSATDSIPEPSLNVSVTSTDTLSDVGGISLKTNGEASVASTIATVSGVVIEQIEIAKITANLRKKLVPLLPEFSLSTGINGAAEVNEFAQMVNDLNKIRKSYSEARV